MRKGRSNFITTPPFLFRCRKWIQNSRRQDLLNKPLEKIGKWGSGYYLCSKHFEPSQFTVPNEKKRLNWNAVPTLFDVPNPPPSVTIKRKLPYRIPAHKVKSIKLEDERVTCHPIPTHSPPKLSPQEWKKS